MIIGFDFDNTIINYKNSFKYIALKKKLIPNNINQDKNSIKDYLKSKNKDEEWTVLQGEVYGEHILRAKIYEGVKDTFNWLLNNNIKIYIISHKTKFPYLGKKINLRSSAIKWINKNLLVEDIKKKISKNDIFFEDSIEKKINKIKELKCNIYVDDLPEILNLLPNNIIKILFSPNNQNQNNKHDFFMNNWNALPKMINKNG